MSLTASAARSHWSTLAVFVLSSSINYLDRTTLSALKPVVSQEFRLSNEDYGWIIAAFSIAYAASAPFAGMFIDRVGLNAAISLAVAVWSVAGIATGFTSGLIGLMVCRAVLGLAEAAGFPAVGKAIHQYIRPAEHALAQAVSQAALSIGMMSAPVLATWIALRSGWRMAFVVTGIFGLVWIPVWHWAARRSAEAPAAKTRSFDSAILRDHRLWVFAGANAVGMLGYSLWTQWTTPYLVEARNLSLAESAWISWIPPLFGALGGLGGGWLSKRLIGRGVPAVSARFRVCLLAAIASLATLAIPFAPGAGWACAGISLSIAAVAAFSVNMYTLPLDTFGAAHAGFAISMLVMSYGVVQIFWPALGKVIDQHGYTPIISLAAFTPLAACGILWGTRAVR